MPLRFRTEIAVTLAAALALTACGRTAQPVPPLTQTVACSVTARVGETEYRLDIAKDSDEVAAYCFTYPEAVAGLTYAYIGETCTVSFLGQSLAPPADARSIVSVLHQALTASAPVYRPQESCFVGEGAGVPYRLYSLSDGNVSVIRTEDPPIEYYFNYAP